MTEKSVTRLANFLLEVGYPTEEINKRVMLLDQFAENLRKEIAKDLEELETPTSISSDWYGASVRTKNAAIAIVKNGLPNENIS